MKCDRLQECCQGELSEQPQLHCNRTGTCISVSDCRGIVNCEENHRKYQYSNTKKHNVVLFRMDGGIIDENTLKCDYLLVIRSEGMVGVLIELKGTKVAHAIDQIRATLKEFPQFFSECKKVHARVVATQVVPKILLPNEILLKKELLKHHGTLQIKSRLLIEKDTDLL